MAGTGRIYVTAVRGVGDVNLTHKYDVDIRFDIAFDWGGYNYGGAPYSMSCDGQNTLWQCDIRGRQWRRTMDLDEYRRNKDVPDHHAEKWAVKEHRFFRNDQHGNKSSDNLGKWKLRAAGYYMGAYSIL